MPKSQFTDAYALFLRELVAARKAAGVSQVELARRIGREQPFVSLIERGVRRLDVIEFLVIARALEFEPAELFAQTTRGLPSTIVI